MRRWGCSTWCDPHCLLLCVCAYLASLGCLPPCEWPCTEAVRTNKVTERIAPRCAEPDLHRSTCIPARRCTRGWPSPSLRGPSAARLSRPCAAGQPATCCAGPWRRGSARVRTNSYGASSCCCACWGRLSELPVAGRLEEHAWAFAEPAVTSLVDAYTQDAYARSTSDVMRDTAVRTALTATKPCCLSAAC